MGTNPFCSIIVPAYNEEQYIERCLAALRSQSYPEELYEIIVVDNGSTDKTLKIAGDFTTRTYTLAEGNVGAVRNLGSNKALGSILVFIDADCVVDHRWLERGIRLLTDSKKTAFGGAYRARKEAGWTERLWLLENPEFPKVQEDLLGGCIFIEKNAFETLGGFNERMTSGEDSELSRRLRSADYSAKIVDELSLVHLGNPQTITDFMKRQIWHSENYITFFKDSITDITFWLTIFFVVSFVTMIISIILGLNTHIISAAFIIVLSLPLLLSAKRIYYARYKLRSLTEGIKIYSLDLAYLMARSIGLLKSLQRRFY